MLILISQVFTWKMLRFKVLIEIVRRKKINDNLEVYLSLIYHKKECFDFYLAVMETKLM